MDINGIVLFTKKRKLKINFFSGKMLVGHFRIKLFIINPGHFKVILLLMPGCLQTPVIRFQASLCFHLNRIIFIAGDCRQFRCDNFNFVENGIVDDARPRNTILNQGNILLSAGYLNQSIVIIH